MQDLHAFHVIAMGFEQLEATITDIARCTKECVLAHLAVSIVQTLVLLFHVALLVLQSSDMIGGVSRLDFEDLHDRFQTLQFFLALALDLFQMIFDLQVPLVANEQEFTSVRGNRSSRLPADTPSARSSRARTVGTVARSVPSTRRSPACFHRVRAARRPVILNIAVVM
jgi:hypothetical protein